MLPVPSSLGRVSLVGLVGGLLLSLALGWAPGVTAAGAGLLLLASAFALSVPLGRRVRRQRLEFAWWLDKGAAGAAGAAVPDIPFSLRCYVRHRGELPIVLEQVRPLVGGGVRLLAPRRASIRVKPQARTELSLTLVAPSAGRVVLHGLAVVLRGPLGLFGVPLYFPNPLSVRVLPRAAATRPRLRAAIFDRVTERAGRSGRRRRGGGTELYELRQLVPGDPFRSIAWKASARRGTWMVKEVEEEVQQTRWLLLDVSGTMRGGEPGQRKLDYALEWAAAEARRALDAGDRVGLLTLDGRVLAHVAAAEGGKQMLRIYDALLGATELTDSDLTQPDDDEVLRIVARYVRRQDGVDYAARGELDTAGLLGHLARSLSSRSSRDEVVASTAAGVLARRFCRARGIPLAHRPELPLGQKAASFTQALAIAGARGLPATLTLVTDFDGLLGADSLVGAARGLRLKAHRLEVVWPPLVEEPATSRLEADLARVYARRERRRFEWMRRSLGAVGVDVRQGPRMRRATAGEAKP